MSDMLTVRVTRRHTEALDIDTFELIDVDGKPLPPFRRDRISTSTCRTG